MAARRRQGLPGALRAAFVTGAASGLGRAIALRLAREGFSVAIADIDSNGAAETAREIEVGRGTAVALACDVVDLEQVSSAIDAATKRFGSLDALVNNAGFDIPGFFLESDPADWSALIAVNLMGVVNCTYAGAPRIVARCRDTGYGRIVNIASDAGRVGGLGEAVYSAAKGGVIAFTKAIARELARDKVTVNCVCPGPADTPMTEAIRRSEFGTKLMERMERATPLRRLAAPEDVAGAVAYFIGDEASFLTAQVMSVSGGLTIPG
ncbi:MAG: SDR family NAD(P)-dependent oxidoreductase [Actinomycetota bacterium]